jgi:hypothetical protein
MGEFGPGDNEAVRVRLMAMIKELRELLPRLSIDFDENHIGRTAEVVIPDFDPYVDRGIEWNAHLEIEEVGRNPVQKVCRLVCRRNGTVTMYSIVVREYKHVGAQRGEFNDAFWASALIGEEGNLTTVNGLVLPLVTVDGLRLIPTEQQLDEDTRAARVDVADVGKIQRIIESMKRALLSRDGEMGSAALRLVK